MLPPGKSCTALRVVCVVGVLSLWVLLAINIERTDLSLLVPHVHIESQHLASNSSNVTTFDGFLVYTAGCRLPDLDPLDRSILPFVEAPPTIDCVGSYGSPPLVTSDLTSLRLDPVLAAAYNVSTCCYTTFWRETAPPEDRGKGDVDSRTLFSKNCVPFDKEAIITDEFVRVECVMDNGTVYKDYHAFTPLKNSSGGHDKRHGEEADAVSVLVVGVDAVSRLNFYRQMPQTLMFLKDNLSAVELLGYNKVADNTFPNLIPVLAGSSVKELEHSCWTSSKAVFDECPFVWGNFSAAGYRTGFGEDSSWMGIFNYLKRGFLQQPTDYYFKPFNHVSEADIGFEKRLNAKLCVGPRKTLETLLSYASKFAVSLKDVLSFGFFWGASLTHDFLNYPKLGDSDHKAFLESLYNSGVLNRTVLVFMSDHGIRWGGIRRTYQGFIEERLPFLYIVCPPWFRQKYTTAVANLQRNAHRLTTPFDLHELLLDLTNLSRIEKDTLRKRSNELAAASPTPRGISLFLPVPKSRTCAHAGIDDHWCTCHLGVTVSINSTEVRRAAAHVVKHINWLLREHNQCSRLQLANITSAREERSTSTLTDFTPSDAGIKDLSLTIETTPGHALFEATIRHFGDKDEYSLVGTVSRINLYGNQSNCVFQYKLRLYCYCAQ